MNERHEAIASAKNIYWFPMPASINDEAKIEFLKRDVFLHHCPISGLDNLDLEQLKASDNDMCAYFFNLDAIFQAEGAKDTDVMHAITKRVAQMINAFVPHKCIVHSSIIDPQIKAILNNEKLIFIQKNLADAKVAIGTILSLLPIMLGDRGREGRSFIRLNLYPEQQIKVQMARIMPPQPEGSEPEALFEGVIKDLSIGGLGLIMGQREAVDRFALKTPVKLKINLPRAIVRVNMGVIVRRKEVEGELGVQFNLLNHKMINEMDGTVLSGYIFSQLRNLLK